MATTESRLDPKILILFMVIGLIPMGIGSLLLLTGARDAHVDEVALQLSEFADNAQTSVSDYLQRLIVQVASIGTVPDVRTLVMQSNALKLTPEQEQIDKDWPNLDPNKSALLASILGNNASRFLRDYMQFSPSIKEIMVTDLQGRLVAASQKTTDYLQADERWWTFAYRQGAGGHFLSDIHYDESAGTEVIEIAEPVIDPVTQSAVGVIKAVLDAQEIFGLINSIDVGSDGSAALLRADGTVVISRKTTVAQQAKVAYIEEIRNAIANNQRSIEVVDGGEQTLLGLPVTKLQATYPELDWYLVVQKKRDSAHGYFLHITRSFFYIVAFSIGLVIVLSIVFSWILSRPVIEVDPHLEQL